MQTEAQTATKPTAREIAKKLYAGGMRCNCNLDAWQPEASTGHSHVCRIHSAALAEVRASR